MMLSTIIGLIISLVHAANVTDLPYPVEIAQFHGTYGGFEYQLNGTAQEVWAQLQRLYPDIKTKVATHSEDLTFESRTSSNKNGLLCCPIAGWNWAWAKTDDVEAGISYLNGRGRLSVGAGPGACSRISCSYNSAIYLCNDNTYPINPAAAYIATYANDIAYQCSTGAEDPAGGISSQCCGQEFDSDKYNVIVRGERC